MADLVEAFGLMKRGPPFYGLGSACVRGISACFEGFLCGIVK